MFKQFLETKPKLQVSYKLDNESLSLELNYSVLVPPGNKFRPERVILLYSENDNTSYKFVNKYCKYLKLFKLN